MSVKESNSKLLSEWIEALESDYAEAIRDVKHWSDFYGDWMRSLSWALAILRFLMRANDLGFDINPVINDWHTDAINRLHQRPENYEVAEAIVRFFKCLEEDLFMGGYYGKN